LLLPLPLPTTYQNSLLQTPQSISSATKSDKHDMKNPLPSKEMIEQEKQAGES
uniref:Uncharacterized protein n=2 Tax=Ursus TaxID=9639 RepID=A0A452VDS3_URSMA